MQINFYRLFVKYSEEHLDTLGIAQKSAEDGIVSGKGSGMDHDLITATQALKQSALSTIDFIHAMANSLEQSLRNTCRLPAKGDQAQRSRDPLQDG